MGFAKIQSAQIRGLDVTIVDVEVDITRGLYAFSIIGLGDRAIEESRDRVSSAIKHTGITPPKQKSEKITVSLAPAHVKKQGPLFDVAIAVGYLIATGTIPNQPQRALFIGELSLDGTIKAITGALPITHYAKHNGYTTIFLPAQNAREAALVNGIKVIGVATLKELIDHLTTKNTLSPTPHHNPTTPTQKSKSLRHIQGQSHAKRAALIALSGGHNMVLYGPPGTGKTMLAQTLRELMPPLSFTEILEVASIHAAAGIPYNTAVPERPFRAPHHSSSFATLIGGGSAMRPGEVTLAHHGILLLDEFPEFDRRAIESLRQPLEEGTITVTRTSGVTTYPARCMVVAALNPCPCGYFTHTTKPCTCTTRQIQNYQQKLSGPIIDRFDLWVHMHEVSPHDVLDQNIDTQTTETNYTKTIERVRQLSEKRQGMLNARIQSKDIRDIVQPTKEIADVIEQATQTLHLSARGVHKLLRVAQTIADIEHSHNVTRDHVLEALRYRKT